MDERIFILSVKKTYQSIRIWSKNKLEKAQELLSSKAKSKANNYM